MSDPEFDRDTYWRSLVASAGDTLTQRCHGASYDAGWWNHPVFGTDMREALRAPADAMDRMTAGLLVAQKLCLAHSELSEGMEGHRKSLNDDKLPHRTMLEVELADAVIRIFDLAGAMRMDLGGAIAEKLAFNAQRADHKPEARAAAGGKSF
jgi:NTP pyrophosphatase (non-canonical NTP hydrolase)